MAGRAARHCRCCCGPIRAASLESGAATPPRVTAAAKLLPELKCIPGFALDLMVKDVSIADGLIKKLTNTNPLSENVLSYLISSLDSLGKNSDHTEVYKVLKN